VSYHALSESGYGDPALPRQVIEQVEIQTKYEGYIDRQQTQVEQHRRLEGMAIPEDIDYDAIPGLSNEGKEKFKRVRPVSIGQASRIAGVTPVDVSVLLVYLEQRRRRKMVEKDTAA